MYGALGNVLIVSDRVLQSDSLCIVPKHYHLSPIVICLLGLLVNINLLNAAFAFMFVYLDKN